MKKDRSRPMVSDDGSLLAVSLEAEVHVCALHSLIQAISTDHWLDMTLESSHWHYSAISALYRDLNNCGFTRSRDCSQAFLISMAALINGTPVFGDDFSTNWSFYSLLHNHELAHLVETLTTVSTANQLTNPNLRDKKQPLDWPERLSDDAHMFVAELSALLEKVLKSGLNAYIVWW